MNIKQVGLIALTLVMLIILEIYLPEDLGEEDTRYCEMVKLHIDSGNDKLIGWPDYRNNYDEVCE